MKNHENQLGTMKNHENQPETMKNQSMNKQKHYKHNLPIIYRFDTFTRLIRKKKWHFCGVKFLAWKSGSVKFWTNNVSVRWSRPQIYIALSISDGNWIASSKGKANVLYFHHSVVEVIVEPEHMRGRRFVAQAQWKISPPHCHSRSPGDQR